MKIYYTEKIAITSNDYERAHMKKPKNVYGTWYFKFSPAKDKNDKDEFADTKSFTGTLSDAKAKAREYAIQNGYTSADIMS